MGKGWGFRTHFAWGWDLASSEGTEAGIPAGIPASPLAQWQSVPCLVGGLPLLSEQGCFSAGLSLKDTVDTSLDLHWCPSLSYPFPDSDFSREVGFQGSKALDF